jgi:hypothetical protein
VKPAPQFFCYGPRPKHADLPPLERAVLQVLKDARGIFINIGMTPSLIGALLHVVVDESAIRWALRQLLDGGFVEHPPMRLERWRAKK